MTLTVTPACCFSMSMSANFRPSGSWSKIYVSRLMLFFASLMARNMAAIVCGPSNSRVTLLPLIKGTPVAASSSAAWAFKSMPDLAQRLLSKAARLLTFNKAPLPVITLGLATGANVVLRFLTSGSEAHAARVQHSSRAVRQDCMRLLIIFEPCLSVTGLPSHRPVPGAAGFSSRRRRRWASAGNACPESSTIASRA